MSAVVEEELDEDFFGSNRFNLLSEEKNKKRKKNLKKIPDVDPNLLCKLCDRVYTQPKLLDCMHTFCLVCLNPHITAPNLPEPADNQCMSPDAAEIQIYPNCMVNWKASFQAQLFARIFPPDAQQQPEEQAPAQPAEPPAAQPVEPAEPVEQPVLPKSFVTCPTCNEHTEITTTVEELDKNYELQNLIEVLESEKRGGPKCRECTENNDVRYYCEDCPLSMCEKCYEFHKRQTMFMDHRIKQSTEVLPAQLIRGHRDYCKQPRHNSQLLYFCTECKVNICIHCPNSKAHKNHPHVFIDNMLEEKKDEVDGMINKGQQACQSIKDFLDISQQMLHNTGVEKDKSIKTITDTFDQVQLMLTQQKENLIKQINDNFEDGSKSLEKARRQAEILKALLEYGTTANDMADQIGNIVIMTDLMTLLDRQFKKFDVDSINASTPVSIPPDAAVQNNPTTEVFGMTTTSFQGNKGNIQVGIQKKSVAVTDPLFQTSLENLKKAMELFAQN